MHFEHARYLMLNVEISIKGAALFAVLFFTINIISNIVCALNCNMFLKRFSCNLLTDFYCYRAGTNK